MKKLIALSLFTLMISMAVTIQTSAQNSEKKILRHWHKADSLSQHHQQAKAAKKNSTANKKVTNVPK